ncbi:hypothetical protein M8J75_006111 [Diaphorina citri]|nr:hypothetical protein M8J75_006111 [Diaphorina citri]
MTSSHQLTGCGPSKHLFNGKNYSDWAFRMKVAIEEKELEECIEKPPTEDMTGKLKKKYLQSSSLDDDQIQFIVDSGATDHLVNDDSYFNGGAITLKNPITIAVAKECESLNATKITLFLIMISSKMKFLMKRHHTLLLRVDLILELEKDQDG